MNDKNNDFIITKVEEQHNDKNFLSPGLSISNKSKCAESKDSSKFNIKIFY